MELIYTFINAGILAYGGVMDYKKREIPDLVPVTLMLTGFLNGTLILPRIICFLITATALLMSAKLSKNSLPGGDFKLICALTFSSGLCSIAAALLLTGLCAILLSIIRKQPIKRNIPLCTYVAPAYMITGAAQLILQGGLS
jgi:Flp pilus assembly protein protease CpaA